MRRWHRREYLRRHEQQRRADLKAEGARRIDVTLRGKALDDYTTVAQYLKGLNRLADERGFTKRLLKDGKPLWLPIRLSDTEVIKKALSHAASAILADEEQARRQGLWQMLAD